MCGLYLNNKSKGYFGESIACEYIKKRGFQIISRNYFAGYGQEIDIIALKSDLIIFLEVKTQFKNMGIHDLEKRLNYHKKRSLLRAANQFIHSRKIDLNLYMMRFDAMFILTDGKNNRVMYYENIISC